MATNSSAEVLRAIGVLEGKIDGIMVAISGLHKDHSHLRGDYEKLSSRVSRLENKFYLYAGAIAIVSPVLLTALSVSLKWFIEQ